MKIAVFKLGWAPSVNHYKQAGRLIKTKSGKRYQPRINSPATKLYYMQAMAILLNTMPDGWGEIGRDKTIIFEVTIYLYPPRNYRYDVDNRAKVVLDSLVKGGIIADDSQIKRLTIEKMYADRPNGHIEVIVETLNVD